MMKVNLLSIACLAGIFACTDKVQKVPESFEVHPDFNLELVASEPLVFDPVEFKFDELGRAFVLEMPGYPMGDIESRLVRLLDTDEDGIYDKRQIYNDSLGVATSFMPYKDGFLVAAPPHLLWLGDKDNDGRADQRKIVMDGFSEGNLQHNFNGLTYGLDNWIYAANGGNSGEPYFMDRPEDVLDLRGSDFKFHLEQKVMQRVGKSSRGFKITFDDWGRLYETHNLEHISHLVFEDRYLEGLPIHPTHALINISDHEENGLSRIYPIGEQETRLNNPEQSGYFSGACGITHYGGGIFPGGFNSGIFVADCVLNLIHMDIISKNGASFKAERNLYKKEFLASKDRSFRPVNMTVGPNGALYVVDMYRDIIEHPEWIPDELEAQMDFNAGKEKGRIYRIVPKGHKFPDVKPLPIDDPRALVEALGSSNQWQRMTAQRILVTERRREAIPFLKESLNNLENPLVRLHALWVLEGLDALKEHELVNALTDGTSGVRENVLKIAEKRIQKNPRLLEHLLGLAQDDDVRVRMRAALLLGTLDEAFYLNHREKIANAMTRLLALPENDEWITKSVVGALQYQAFDFAQNTLETFSANTPSDQILVCEILLELVGKEKNWEEKAGILTALAQNNIPSETMSQFIEALSRGCNRGKLVRSIENPPSNVIALIESLERENDVSLLKSMGMLRKALGLPVSPQINGFLQKASLSLFDSGIPVSDRLDLLQLIRLDDFEKREDLLYGLLGNIQPLQLQEEALSQCWDSNNPKVARNLLGLWPNLGLRARNLVTDFLLFKSTNHDVLLTALEKGKMTPGEFNLNSEQIRILFFSGNENIRNRAKALFSGLGEVQRQDVVEKMRPALTMEGDVDKGMEVFFNFCAQCHIYGDIGDNVGPVLTEINRKSKESLLHDILNPNAAVDAKYLNYKVQTQDGNIYTGMVVHETDSELSLRMAGGIEKTIAKNHIAHFSSTGSSMMYEGLENSINEKEMADLLAFLQQGIR